MFYGLKKVLWLAAGEGLCTGKQGVKKVKSIVNLNEVVCKDGGEGIGG